MKKQKQLLLLFGLSFLAYACNVKPRDIQYGKEHCSFCDMTIVDKTHAAELVTTKGKVYVYDAVECMLHDYNRNLSDKKMAYILVADYANPGNLTDAVQAYYLISPKIKSPMGGNLSAFNSKIKAEEVRQQSGGEIYLWEAIRAKFQ